MRILILGGTGAIGVPLVNYLAERGHDVYVTTRRKQTQSRENVHYLIGNAREIQFISEIIGLQEEKRFDVIVDFMVYTSKEFEERVELLINNSKRYIFVSSSRVFASEEGAITEESVRLLDCTEDAEYIKTDEYALAKARQENILRKSSKKNWIIIRPYISYNEKRLQLGSLEKELWLFRALNGKSIVFSKDIADKYTTMTYAGDVALRMVKVIEDEKIVEEDFNIVTNEFVKWEKVLEIYLDTIEQCIGSRPKVFMTDDYRHIAKAVRNPYQNKYDRLYNRKFNNAKIEHVCYSLQEYVSLDEGLRKCVMKYCASRSDTWEGIRWRIEGYFDKLTGEKTRYKDIPTWKNKIKYFCGYCLRL